LSATQEVTSYETRSLDATKRLGQAVILKIFESLDFGQRLNLQTQSYMLDYRWNENSPNVFERELALLKRDKEKAPLGSLLVDNRLFPMDPDGNLYLLHMTLGKKTMLASPEKEIYTTVRSVGPVVYTTSILKDASKSLAEGGRIDSLAREHWQNLQYRNNLPPDHDRDDYYLAFKVPYGGKDSNRNSNWIDYLGFGRAYLETQERLKKEPRWSSEKQAVVENEVVRQFNETHELLAAMMEPHVERSLKDWGAFWGNYAKLREGMPVMNQLFFEILKGYMTLYQNDVQSTALAREGDPNTRNNYSLVYEVDPSLKSSFNAERFQPDYDALKTALSKRIQNFDEAGFQPVRDPQGHILFGSLLV